MRNSEKPNLAYLKHFRTSTNSHKRSTYNYESEGRRFESCRARSINSSYLQGNPARPFLFSGVLPAPYHNRYHNETQEGFENIRPKRPMASRCMWGVTCE
jgi:hypothetical protein